MINFSKISIAHEAFLLSSYLRVCSVNVIIWLMLSVYLWSKVSTLSGFHCNKHLVDYCLLIGAPRQSGGMKEQMSGSVKDTALTLLGKAR